ncbi:MAG: hypothetical protein C6P37_10605 [Caldibacillus debilis]|uniref:Uncharacterized protein n=1 Tax=Caldibacillus debilis TaxID=301148 RepID=A0A3E0K3M2_9BACI|nr:MAG: hypothetical protein C6P37_10605 [Caldibacillus debilis]
MLNGFGAPTKLSPAVFLSIKKSGRRKGLPPAKPIFFLRKHVVLFPDPHSIRENLLCAWANRVPQGKRILYPSHLVAPALASIHGPFRLVQSGTFGAKNIRSDGNHGPFSKGRPIFAGQAWPAWKISKKKRLPRVKQGTAIFVRGNY